MKDQSEAAAKNGKSPAVEASLEDRMLAFNKALSEYTSPAWDRLPDIELYMDQVITFLDRHMELFRKDSEERIITPSMINNYVKDSVIPRAEAKKYSKEHIALIMTVCSLKKVLSMPDLATMLSEFSEQKHADVASFYEKFRGTQQNAIRETTERVEAFLSDAAAISPQTDEDTRTQRMKDLALRLAIYSQISGLMAEKILAEIEKK